MKEKQNTATLCPIKKKRIWYCHLILATIKAFQWFLIHRPHAA